MTRLLDSPQVDHAAVAAALDGLRDRGATCQAYMRAGGSNVCVNAVNAGGDAWSRYSESASRRAATSGRRLLPVIDSGEIDGRLWIAYDIGSATSLVERRGRHLLPTATSLHVLPDVARALDAAAAEGVFACELRPDSVFLSGQRASLGDLGTAREALVGAEYELEGDPAYVPPEVLRGQRAGERSGVYLYGALLHYLLTGGPPQNACPGPPVNGQPGLPASIKAMVATAMAEDPEMRPPSVSDAHDMARRALRGEPPARPRKQRPTKTGAAKCATAKTGTQRRAVALFGALMLGSAAGLALAGSPEPEPARAQTVRAEGMSVTVPSGGHRVDSSDRTLLVRTPGSRLRARIVSRPPAPRPGARPVRLGALQAWRRAAEGLVRYSIPTSQGTLEVTCRATSAPSPRPLRLCERTVSTLRLRDAKALPLAAATEDSRRLGVAVATLIAERDAARGRLGSAPTPNHQRLVAQELAEIHRRAATILHGLAGAEAIEAAARDAADGYARLAAAAGGGAAAHWDEAREQVRRSDAVLAEGIAAAR
jgi:Protein kinase domain